jgi:hypothetical protein
LDLEAGSSQKLGCRIDLLVDKILNVRDKLLIGFVGRELTALHLLPEGRS